MQGSSNIKVEKEFLTPVLRVGGIEHMKKGEMAAISHLQKGPNVIS